MPIAAHARLRAGHRLGRNTRQFGFTLIELAIVCVCIAILAGIAITSYEYATIKARRGAAQGCLTEAAQVVERQYATKGTYAGLTKNDFPACSSDVTAHYDVDFVAPPTASAYTLYADPKGRQKEAETHCGKMTIDQAGRKTPTGNCW